MESRSPRPDPVVATVSPVEEEVRALVLACPRAAWDRVVKVWNERLYVHAWCILKDPSDARDVVQEVFLRAMREPRFFAPDFHMQAWLYRVTRNLCFNLVRDRRRREGILAAAARSEAFDADPIERVFDEQRQDELAAALARLSPDHRAILLLRYYDDLSYAEIAEVLSLKLGTVMSRLSRARDRLLDVVREQRSALLAS
jgi:RNA polymerase sigma-70 factor (ECF subfamily)